MAGCAFALAADPSLLAADARHRGRLRHRGGAARRVPGFRVPAVAARLRRRQRHHSAQGARAGAVEAGRRGPARSAPPIRCGTRMANCARPTPTSKALSTISTPARPDGTQAEDALVLGAGGSSRAVVFGLIERGIKRVHLANRTIERARALADQFGASVLPVGVGCGRRPAAARGTAGEYDVARHARPAAARTRCRPVAAGCRGRRSRLCAAGNAVARRGARARD